MGTKRFAEKDRVQLAVQAVTNSQWTHAAVFMTRTAALHAIGLGTHSVLTLWQICRSEDGRYLFRIPGDQVMVLRPTASALSAWQAGFGAGKSFEAVIGSSLLAYLGRDYARVRDLLRFLPWPINFIATRLASMVGKPIPKHELIEGWYCSELVARVYADAGLHLFDPIPRALSPADLIKSAVLAPVQNAIAGQKEVSHCFEPDMRHIEGTVRHASISHATLRAINLFKAGKEVAGVQLLETSLTTHLRRPERALKGLHQHEADLLRRGILPPK